MLWLNGAKVVAPDEFSVDIYDVSASATRNAEATMLIDRIGSKRKIILKWGILEWSETAILLSSVSDVYFNVTYPDPWTGTYRSITCYRGDISAPVLFIRDGEVCWKGVKMNWIEQ